MLKILECITGGSAIALALWIIRYIYDTADDTADMILCIILICFFCSLGLWFIFK